MTSQAPGRGGLEPKLLPRLFSSKLAILTCAALALLGALSSGALILVINEAIADKSLPVKTFVPMCAFALVAGFAGQYLGQRLVDHSVARIRLLLAERVLALGVRRIETLGSHRLLAVLNHDINMIVGAFSAVVVILTSSAIVLACMVYLLWLSWRATLWLLPLVGVVLVMRLGLKLARRPLVIVRDLQDTLMRLFTESIEGAKELKLHRERRERLRYVSLRHAVESVRDNSQKVGRIYAASDVAMRLLFFVAVAILLQFGFSADLPERVIVGYVLTLIYMMGPLRLLGMNVQVLTNVATSVRKIDSLGLLDGSAGGFEWSEPARAPARACERIELSGVTHVYRNRYGESFTLGPVDLVLQPGEIVFIVGGNGSGKSTLANVLTGIYVPEAGDLFFNGERIDDGNRDWYRQHFSCVFSDFYLLGDLRGSSDRVSDARIRQYLVTLQLDHKVTIEDGVLSTVDLSQGQRRRLALIAAFAEDRPICVFDEWAADQDPVFKEVFYSELLPELKRAGKTIFVITHDDRYFHVGDRIFALDNGKVRQVARPAQPVVERPNLVAGSS